MSEMARRVILAVGGFFVGMEFYTLLLMVFPPSCYDPTAYNLRRTIGLAIATGVGAYGVFRLIRNHPVPPKPE